MQQIFVIGQCTLHWGRMEFGNIGNYYIIEPFFRELHRVFPLAVIKTTFQMTDTFQENEHIQSVPMEEYYAWTDSDLSQAYKEFSIASIYDETGGLIDTTPFIEEVLNSDLVIDYSGDIWGANADLVGKNRFLIGLLKDRVVQLLKRPIAMIAGSPGPFNTDSLLPFAQEVYNNFDLVTNRESISVEVLRSYGFKGKNIEDCYNLACPAFMFEPASQEEVHKHIQNELFFQQSNKVGFVICGWNLLKGPFSRTDWTDDEFAQYVSLIQHLVIKHGTQIYLMSHANGFTPPQKEFFAGAEKHLDLFHGRDYPLVERLYNILRQTSVASSVHILTGVYSPAITKGIISNFDMMISGRVHAAVAGLSQNVPTMIIDYGHEPKAHKLKGFAQVAGVADYVVDPANTQNMIEVADRCWENRTSIHTFLTQRNIEIRKLAKQNFDLLKSLITDSDA